MPIDAPVLVGGMAHSMADSMSFLHAMMEEGDINSEYTKSVYPASSTSELSEVERKPHGHNCNKDK